MRLEQVIRANHGAILADWLAEVDTAASARGLTQPELRNMMPRYLWWLADKALETPANGRALVESHVASRLRMGFTAGEVVEEFAVLGRCIAKQWAHTSLQARPPVADIKGLFAQLHGAATTVADLYTQHLLQDEQTEKRYLREIQSIASACLADDGVPLPSRFRPVLDLVREALSADVTALMLYDPRTNRMVMAAAAGVGDRDLEQYVTQAVPAPDNRQGDTGAQIQRLGTDVADALRRAGIQSLLSVRLPEHRTLLGVMYAGISELRPFSAREVRRIEAFGQHLTIYLDNARVFAQLRDRVLALETERTLRDDFVAVLAHDLRGPLSAARLLVQRLALHPEKVQLSRELALKIQRTSTEPIA